MPLIINNFQKGQSSSPYLTDGAFSKSANLDIWGQEGIARINYKPTLSLGTITGLMISSTMDSDGNVFMADIDKDVYSYTLGTTATKISASSIIGSFVVYWEGYLFAINTTELNIYGTGTTWYTFQSNLSAYFNHKPFYSSWDGKLYIPNIHNVARLSKIGTFDRENAGTYTWSTSVFAVPPAYKIMSINELGNYLVLACNSTATIGSGKTTFFFWDRSATTSDYIYELGENSMFNLFKVGETLLVGGGMSGRIYELTTSGIKLYSQIPFDYDNSKRISINSDLYSGTSMGHSNLGWWNNQLIVGTTSLDGLSPAGIYGIKGKPNCLFTISSGEDGSTGDVYIGMVLGIDDEHLIYSWKTYVGTTTTYGMDIVKNSNNRTITYGSYFESLLYAVGTKTAKKSYDRVEVELARPLQTGEGVLIKYRTDISSSWTTLDTQDYTTYGAVSSLDFPGIHNLENIQIRCELTTGATSKNTPYLKEIRLID